MQYPPQILEIVHYLKELCSVLPSDTEGPPRAILRYIHIPFPTPHLRIPIASVRPLMLDNPPLWHVNYAQVAAGKRFLSLLNHRYL